MSVIEINLRPDARTLRQFGWIALVGFLLLGAMAWHGWLVFAALPDGARPPAAAGLAGLGLLAGIFSALHPRANRPIYVALSLVALPIGLVLSYLIMGGLFYLLFTPVRLLLALSGRDPLLRRREPDSETYWVDARTQRSKQSYFRQF
jgi:protein-S-isoprenylcysteine O-methyltransferase Ste14